MLYRGQNTRDLDAVLAFRTMTGYSGDMFSCAHTIAYGYNARSEVTSARRTLADDPDQGVRGFSYDYAYDPIGNRTSATEAVGGRTLTKSYTANALNQYSQRMALGYAGVRGDAANTATWRLGTALHGDDFLVHSVAISSGKNAKIRYAGKVMP